MNNRTVLIILFVLAVTVRLFYIAGKSDVLVSDEKEYDRLAMSLVDAKGYVNSTDGRPTSLRPPFYAFFLSLVYRAWGRSIIAARIVQAFLSACMVCVLFLISREIFDDKSALLAGFVATFYMTYVTCSGLLYTETIFCFLLTLAVYLSISAGNLSIPKAIAIGSICGIMSLTRSEAFFMPLLIIISLVIRMYRSGYSDWKRPFFAFLVMSLSFLMIVIPWSIRNSKVHGRFVILSTNAGLNMYQAVNPVDGKIFGLGPRDETAEKADTILNEAERSDYYVSEAKKTYLKDPFRAIKMFIMRFLFFWSVIDWEIIGGDVINYHFLFILPFAFIGYRLAVKKRKKYLPLLLTVLYFSSMVLLFQGTPRYRMPIDGFVILFGCYGIRGSIHEKRYKIIPIVLTALFYVLTYFAYEYSLYTKAILRSAMRIIGLW